MSKALTPSMFGSIGGDYFECLVALALDSLGYREDTDYVASWRKACVPGTWIEADFIIDQTRKHSSPIDSGRVVFAIGHATSANSAQMKFHRDFEQLLEVKALPSGDEYRVVDILFCCPRVATGGWSEELVSVIEAVFDASLVVWHHDWGMEILEAFQRRAGELPQGNSAAKKRYLSDLLASDEAFASAFERFTFELSSIAFDRESESKISRMFLHERKLYKKRCSLGLLISEPRETDFKRGLLRLLAFTDDQFDIMLEYMYSSESPRIGLDEIIVARGGGPKEIQNFETHIRCFGEFVGVLEWGFSDLVYALDPSVPETLQFKPSPELKFVFQHFTADQLRRFRAAADGQAPQLMAYLIDLRDLGRAKAVLEFIEGLSPQAFVKLCQEAFADGEWRGMAMPRLLPFEVAKSAISSKGEQYGYRAIAIESGDRNLLAHSPFLTVFAGKKGTYTSREFMLMCSTVGKRLRTEFPARRLTSSSERIIERFISDRFDSLMKQTQIGVVDLLIEGELQEFAIRVGGFLERTKIRKGIRAFVNRFANDKAKTDLNIEIPYTILLPDRRVIYVHRVMADGGVGHKRKELASKIRMIRYEWKGDRLVPRSDYAGSILVIDGSWMTGSESDPTSPIRMLTVAGWDYVVFPDQLGLALGETETKISLRSGAAVLA